MKLVLYFGQLYRLTNSNYLKMITAIADGCRTHEDADPSVLGKCVGAVEADVTDMEQERAQMILEGELEKKENHT